MLFMDRIVERKIQEAMQDGAFEGLPGAGKPLPLDEDAAVPEDVRLTYKVLKNAGFVPPELEWRKEMVRLQDLVAGAVDALSREAYRKQLAIKQLQFDEAMQRMGRGVPAAYRQALYAKLEKQGDPN
ncbi:DnaJ family domain-containing protein [Acanthopleuribacter pedis]|uniref:DUF1992 domain-containing protein n=1 Tax=Acanthopleuribacter pedis TaxID=442870 RepID=A0A8J7U7Q8_9BACT|nr:DnaJ family domain-containing protein [Acanthopleuribacter pedis]MBO1321666.1 DUF1992 domain-containing protein [Acanthopleuribacter pedis]